MNSVCVYLGANPGRNEHFKDAVIELAHEIVAKNLTLVYGGSRYGLMGLLASTVKELGGKVTGIITHHLMKEKEKPLETLDDLHIVDTMQERKQRMMQIADFFIVMPGGIGTLEEAFDTWNAIKIGELNKKIGFLNIDGYFDDLFKFIAHCQKNDFVTESQANIPAINSKINLLMNELCM